MTLKVRQKEKYIWGKQFPSLPFIFSNYWETIKSLVTPCLVCVYFIFRH